MNGPDDFVPKPRPRLVDHSAEVESAIGRLAQSAQQPKPPTDREYVANSIDACRYLDLKGVAKDILGEAKPTTPAELADLMAEWAAANKTKVPT